MPSILEECRTYFGCDDFYTILTLHRQCSITEVKRAYHKLSLQVHPDRIDGKAEKEVATKKFQTLGKIYSILSDKEKRKIYDETGTIDEENDIPQDRDWYDYWRLLFCKINVQDIKEFEEKYKDSEEELDDIKSAYIDYEGDMDQILENVLCTTIEDEPRFRKTIDSLIKKKVLPKFPAYSNESSSKKKARKRQAEKEAEEAEVMKAEMGMGDTDDALKQLIQQRQNSRQKDMNSFFDQLEAKYAAKPSGKKKGKKGK